MNTPPSLLLDIWLDVMDRIASIRDLSRLGRTCHCLRSASYPRLMGAGAISLRNAKKFASFAAFIASGVGDCAQLVQSLAIGPLYSGPPADDSLWVESLVYIIGRCTRAETLFLDCPILAHDSRIGTALADVTHIKYIILSGESDADYLTSPLSSMRSRCTCVTTANRSTPGSRQPSFDPIMALSAFTRTLVTLDLCEPRLRSHSIAYPCLTTLSISRWNVFDLKPLLQSFPALQDLEIVNILYDEQRMTNEQVQNALRARNRDISFMAHWSGLNRFTGSVDALYLLGITRHIRYWNVLEPISSTSAIERFNACIADIRPSQLRVTFARPEISVHAIAATLASGCLTHLDIALEDPMPSSMDDIIVSPHKYYGNLSLTNFGRRIVWLEYATIADVFF